MFRTTIYFDTSFYVSLQRAEAAVANAIIDQLQDLGVRRVESFELFIELDASPNTSGKRLLVDRLARWTLPPLRLAKADLAWLAVEDRPTNYAKLLAAKRIEAKAYAFSASASQPLPYDDVPFLEKNVQRDLGIEFAMNDSESHLAMMSQIVDQHDLPTSLTVLLEETQALLRGVASGENDKATLARRAAVLLERIRETSEVVSPGIARENAISLGVLTGNTRARNIALGRASEKSEKRHIATINDLEHLALFLRNTDSIDLLMMDGHNWTRSTSMRRQRFSMCVGEFLDLATYKA